MVKTGKNEKGANCVEGVADFWTGDEMTVVVMVDTGAIVVAESPTAPPGPPGCTFSESELAVELLEPAVAAFCLSIGSETF